MDIEYWLDMTQWPAMIFTLIAAWLVGSKSKSRRTSGFWWFTTSNALWMIWGWHTQAYALIALQIGLLALNVRGILKNQDE